MGMQKQPNIWRKNFAIQRIDMNIASETAPGFGGLNYLTVGRNVMSRYIWVTEKLDNTGSYFLKHELRELAKLTLKTIQENPARVNRVNRQAAELNTRYFRYAHSLRKLDLSKLSNAQLLAKHGKLFQLQYQSHCWALPTTWFVDSDREDLSNFLSNFASERVAALNVNRPPAAAFSLLTSPVKESKSAEEERESLRVLAWIRSLPKLKHWFASHTTEELVRTFPALPAPWKRKMRAHYERWCWLPYTYIGPAYTLDYYLEVWRGLIHEDLNPGARLTELGQKSKAVQAERKKVVRELRLSKREQEWFNIAADIVWLKGYRKDCYFHGFFVLDLLLAEVGRRSGLSLMQAKYLLPGELPQALRGKDLANTANARMQFSVVQGRTPPGKNLRWTSKGLTVLTGSKAKAFLKKQRFEKVAALKADSIQGTCACSGSARGVVRVVNLPEEMGKMNEGDIMLAHTTFPSLVPAMKKAAAIVTEDGGITCHAAIVARELQTPCIVGCKNVLSVLKDGDIVEVNADAGTVKKVAK